MGFASLQYWASPVSQLLLSVPAPLAAVTTHCPCRLGQQVLSSPFLGLPGPVCVLVQLGCHPQATTGLDLNPQRASGCAAAWPQLAIP